LILATPHGLLADLFVTLILPLYVSHLTATRGITPEIYGFTARNAFAVHLSEVSLESEPGVIRLTITA